MIESVKGQFASVTLETLGQAALTLFTWPIYALGWLVGFTVRFFRWIIAAVLAGYHEGSGS